MEILDHPSLQHEEFLQTVLDRLIREDKLNQLVSVKLPDDRQSQRFSALEDIFTENIKPFYQAEFVLFCYNSILSHMVLKNIGLVDLILDVFSQCMSFEFLQELLPCAVYVNNKILCEKLIDLGAVPDEGCVRALCGSPCVSKETAELSKLILGKLVQWDSFAEHINSMMCIAVDKGNSSLIEIFCEKMIQGYYKNDAGLVLTSVLEMLWAGNVIKSTGLRDTIAESIAQALLSTGCECDVDYLAWLASSSFSSKVLNVILKTNVDVNSRYRGKTALHQAVQFGGSQCVRFLLDHGADASSKVEDNGKRENTEGYTVLHLSAETHIESCSKTSILCEHLRSITLCPVLNIQDEQEISTQNEPTDPANYKQLRKYVNKRNYDWNTPLHLASWIGNTEIIKILIKAGADVNARNFNGDTPLHLSVKSCNTECTKILIEAKASVNVTNVWNNKPLNCAYKTKFDIVQILLDAGSDVNYAYGTTGSCLHIAVIGGDIKTVRFLLRRGANVNVTNRRGQTCLMVATTNGDLDMIKYLCQQGASADVIDDYGQTVIHTTLKVHNESVEKLQYLLDVQKAPVNVKDKHGRTAMFHAVESGDIEIVELLKYRGFKTQQVDKNGTTLLYATCEAKTKNLDDLLKMLIPMKDDKVYQEDKNKELTNTVNNQNNYGETVLTLIAKKNLDCDLQFLVERDVNPNIPDHQGRTALHYMAENSRSKYIKIMLDADADPCVKDLNGKTPLHISADQGDHVSVKLFLNKGADPHVTDLHGRSALHFAAGIKITESVQLLLDGGANPNQPDNKGQNPLHIAMVRGCTQITKLLLERGAKPCVLEKQRRTPLHIACTEKGNDISKILLEKGATLSALVNNSQTQLHIAAENGNSECISRLLKNGSDPNFRDKQQLTALHIAAQKDQSECMNILLDNGADLNAVQLMGMHKSALHIAAEEGSYKCISTLLDRGIDPNYTDKRGRIPLHLASDKNLLSVQLLLERGSNLSSVDKMGITLIHVAAGKEKLGSRFVKLLLERGADPNVADRKKTTPLHNACLTGSSESIRLLIEAGADPNRFDKDQRTPLIIAAKTKSNSSEIEFIRELLEGGADPNVCNPGGKTPLHFAADFGSSDSVEHLLNKGANPSVADDKGWTPLHYAAKRNKKGIANLLLRKDIKINALNERGQTPLHIAANNRNIVKLLLEFGANPNVPDTEGKTSLHIAVTRSNVCSVKFLLDSKGDTSLVDHEGNTPLLIAARNVTCDCVKLLLKYGANVHVVNQQDRTPLHIAAEKGHSETVDLLLGWGANSLFRDNKGRTPLHLTLTSIMKMQHITSEEASKYLRTLASLVEHGSDLSVKDFEGTSPLDILQSLQISKTEICNVHFTNSHYLDLENSYKSMVFFEIVNIVISRHFNHVEKFEMGYFIQLITDIMSE